MVLKYMKTRIQIAGCTSGLCIINLAPNKHYYKTHVLPGRFIPGPQKTKVVDSFMVVGLHHLSALQVKGLKVWDSSHQETFHSNRFFLFTTADGPELVYWNGLIGHCGKNGCWLYCGVRGRHKDAHSHYYPALLHPHNGPADSNHSHYSAFEIPLAGSQEYTANLTYHISSSNQCQFKLHQTETGIIKAPLILSLDPMHSLGILLCMMSDIMHLTANVSNLLISLWWGTITCMNSDDIDTWDWAVLCDEQVWKAHDRAVREPECYLPGSFGIKPHNIEDKFNSGYKTWEFFLYTFSLLLGLLHGLLPEPYWSNFCKLIRGFQLICKHQLTHKEVLKACVLLAAWKCKFKEIYYQWCNDWIHFIHPCVHQVHTPSHIQNFSKRTAYLYSTVDYQANDWQPQAANSTILKLPNKLCKGRCSMCTCKCATCSTPWAWWLKGLLSGALDLGCGYTLLRKRDKIPIYPSHGTDGVILDFLNHLFGPLPEIQHWAWLLLPNGQIVCSVWREKLWATDKLQISRMVKVYLSSLFSFQWILTYLV